MSSPSTRNSEWFASTDRFIMMCCCACRDGTPTTSTRTRYPRDASKWDRSWRCRFFPSHSSSPAIFKSRRTFPRKIKRISNKKHKRARASAGDRLQRFIGGQDQPSGPMKCILIHDSARLVGHGLRESAVRLAAPTGAALPRTRSSPRSTAARSKYRACKSSLG
jgi:hypothetical protein